MGDPKNKTKQVKKETETDARILRSNICCSVKTDESLKKSLHTYRRYHCYFVIGHSSCLISLATSMGAVYIHSKNNTSVKTSGRGIVQLAKTEHRPSN